MLPLRDPAKRAEEVSRGRSANSSATTGMAPRDSNPRNLPLALRKTAIPTIGRNSPTAPAAMMNDPNRPVEHVVVPQDRQQCPRAVVVSPIATGTNACTKPAYPAGP